MIPYCGGTYQVQDRVQPIIDDRTGRMIEIGSDCLILKGRRLWRRAQHRPLVLSEGDLSILARGVASARGSRKLNARRVEELTQRRGVNVP